VSELAHALVKSALTFRRALHKRLGLLSLSLLPRIVKAERLSRTTGFVSSLLLLLDVLLFVAVLVATYYKDLLLVR